MGEAKRRKQLDPSFGQVKPAKYVVFNPEKDDYLGSENHLAAGISRGWCTHPGGAIKFSKLEKAVEKAQELVQDNGYTLQVCELTETETQFAVKPVAEVNAGLD